MSGKSLGHLAGKNLKYVDRLTTDWTVFPTLSLNLAILIINFIKLVMKFDDIIEVQELSAQRDLNPIEL